MCDYSIITSLYIFAYDLVASSDIYLFCKYVYLYCIQNFDIFLLVVVVCAKLFCFSTANFLCRSSTFYFCGAPRAVCSVSSLWPVILWMCNFNNWARGKECYFHSQGGKWSLILNKSIKNPSGRNLHCDKQKSTNPMGMII